VIKKAWADALSHPLQSYVGVFRKVEHGDELVGQLMMGPVWGGTPSHPYFQHVARFGMMLREAYWGIGLGRRLLELAQEIARTNGVLRLEAHVRQGNDRGMGLYQSQGFQVEGTRERAAFIDGKYWDEYYIAKWLGTNPDSIPAEFLLRTKRLVIRPLCVGDAEAIYEYAKDPEVSKYTLWEPHQSPKDSMKFITEFSLKNYIRGVPEPLGISLKTDPGRIVGTVGCFWISKPQQEMELAYALARPLWGQGLVVEAAREVMDFCFRELAVERIRCRCKVENIASRRVMEKLGMTYEGRHFGEILHRGRRWDMDYFSVLREARR
jgi:ribosomal-protein-alanine N-acetyltransferase